MKDFIVTVYAARSSIGIDFLTTGKNMMEVRQRYLDKGHLPSDVYVIEVL